MYCLNCGEKLKNGINFCPKCGNQVPSSESFSQDTFRETSSTITQSNSTYDNYAVKTNEPLQIKEETRSKSIKCLAFSLLSFLMAIIAFILGGSFFFLYSRYFYDFLFLIPLAISVTIMNIMGLIFGKIARILNRKAITAELDNSIRKTGKSFAIFGVILNSISIVVPLVFLVIIIPTMLILPRIM